MRAAGLRAIASLLLATGVLLVPVPVAPVPASPPAPAAILPGVSLGALVRPGVATVAAATPDLTFVTDARYVVQPEGHRVRIVLDIAATNHRPDTVTQTYYFERGYLAVLPGISGLRALPAAAGTSAGGSGGSVSAAVASRTSSYTLLSIAFGRRLTSGMTIRFRLQFDLPDPGAPAARPIRIGTSLVTFPVWAFASDGTPGSSVTVVFPSGFDVTVLRGSLGAAAGGANGSTVYRTGPLANPLAWSAYLSAERSSGLVATSSSVTIGSSPVRLTIRRWPDDPAWAKRVGDLARAALPRLSADVGLPYAGARLTISESTSRATGGYAGIFDPKTATIQVAYDASPFVVLHETAHAWFNGGLLGERWANEGFATLYAVRSARLLRVAATPEKLTSALRAARIPLNAWLAIGEESATVERYGYAASYQLATAILKRTDAAHLQAVWADASSGAAAYQPGGSPGASPERRPTGAAPDWRVLLDLLEERTGADFSDLWRGWVVRPEERQLLVDRAAARSIYRETLSAAGEWPLSPLVREALGAWQFDEARRLLGASRDALALQARVATAAAAAGLTVSPAARDAFAGRGGPAAASAVLEGELAAIGAIGAAESAGRASDGGPDELLRAIGTLGADPGGTLESARSAFAAGQLDASVRLAADARAIWEGGHETGRGRLILSLLGIVLVGGLAVLVFGRLRRPARGRPRGRFAAAASAGEEPDPYGTLGDTPGSGGPQPPAVPGQDGRAGDVMTRDPGRDESVGVGLPDDGWSSER